MGKKTHRHVQPVGKRVRFDGKHRDGQGKLKKRDPARECGSPARAVACFPAVGVTSDPGSPKTGVRSRTAQAAELLEASATGSGNRSGLERNREATVRFRCEKWDPGRECAPVRRKQLSCLRRVQQRVLSSGEYFWESFGAFKFIAGLAPRTGVASTRMQCRKFSK